MVSLKSERKNEGSCRRGPAEEAPAKIPKPPPCPHEIDDIDDEARLQVISFVVDVDEGKEKVRVERSRGYYRPLHLRSEESQREHGK
jgi:hypothetical protein